MLDLMIIGFSEKENIAGRTLAFLISDLIDILVKEMSVYTSSIETFW